MVKFEQLPANARALLLAKLAVELRARQTANRRHPAQMRETDAIGLWRTICRKARQPVCTLPLDAIVSD